MKIQTNPWDSPSEGVALLKIYIGTIPECAEDADESKLVHIQWVPLDALNQTES